jgi:flagella basal body P-ring formation protein FlgA
MWALPLLLLLAAPAAAQDFASIRPLATVEEPTLRLGDIFDGAGPRAGQPVGASPAPGRPVTAEEIAATLRPELHRLGMDPEAELDLGPLLPPMIPPGAAPRLAAEGMPVLRQRLAGRAAPTVPAVAATRRLAAGEIPGPATSALCASAPSAPGPAWPSGRSR